MFATVQIELKKMLCNVAAVANDLLTDEDAQAFEETALIMSKLGNPESIRKELLNGSTCILLGDTMEELENFDKINMEFILVVTNNGKVFGCYKSSEIKW